MEINDFVQGEEINLETYKGALENDWGYEVGGVEVKRFGGHKLRHNFTMGPV